MGVKENAQEGLSITTSAAEDAIRRAADNACAAGAVTLQSSIRPAGGDDRRWFYEIMGPGKLVRQMLFEVIVTKNGDQRIVKTEILKYLTTQSKFLMLIPTGPKRMPGMKAYRRFSGAFETELSAL